MALYSLARESGLRQAEPPWCQLVCGLGTQRVNTYCRYRKAANRRVCCFQFFAWYRLCHLAYPAFWYFSSLDRAGQYVRSFRYCRPAASARAVQCGEAAIVACIGGDGAAHRSFEATAANFSSWSVDAAFPYGAGGPNAAFSLITQHYMDKYGARRDDFARIALDQRYNANHYPQALLGHKRLSINDYMDARPIARPLHL